MIWDIEVTDEFSDWYQSLTPTDRDAIVSAVDLLEERGPGLGRPLVDSIKSSRHSNMKELRPMLGGIRILFAFDPRRSAILLIGGNKANQWRRWYEDTIPVADELYDQHLTTLRKEGLIP